MSDPLPAPKFDLTYNVGLTDIGKGYAEGITSAGNSIAGAISGLMGGINPKTGEIAQGIFGQNQTTNEMLDQLTKMKDPEGNPILGAEAYESLMGKSLGTKQKMLGAYMAQFASNMEQEQKIAIAKATAAAQGQYEIAKANIVASAKDTVRPEDRTITITPKKKVTTGNAPPQLSPQQIEEEMQRRAMGPKPTIGGTGGNVYGP